MDVYFGDKFIKRYDIKGYMNLTYLRDQIRNWLEPQGIKYRMKLLLTNGVAIVNFDDISSVSYLTHFGNLIDRLVILPRPEPSDLEKLPIDIIYKILSDLELQDIFNLCVQNSYLNDTICRSDKFWKHKLYHDYGIPANEVHTTIDVENVGDYKRYYLEYYELDKELNNLMLKETLELSQYPEGSMERGMIKIKYNKQYGILKFKAKNNRHMSRKIFKIMYNR